MNDNDRAPLIGEDGEVREVTAADMRHATRRGRPPLPAGQRKRRVTMMLDGDLLARLKADGRGWQTRANALLRQALDL